MESPIDIRLQNALKTVSPDTTLTIILTLPFVPHDLPAVDPLLSLQDQRTRNTVVLRKHMMTAYGTTQNRLREMGLEVPGEPSRVLVVKGPARVIQEVLNTFTFAGASLDRVVPFHL